MAKLLLIKLGGSLITDKGKDFTAKPSVIFRLAKEIKLARKNFSGQIIVAHGSGSFGHSVAARYQTKLGIINKRSLIGLPQVADAAIQINRVVMKELLEVGLPAVSFSPASFIFAKNRRLKKMGTLSLFHSLSLGFLPVLYGDIIFDQEQGFCIFSSETILGVLAKKARVMFDEIKVIYCGNTDGVYDSSGIKIPRITPKTYMKLRKYITGSEQTDVTGGMLHKVQESLTHTKNGVVTRIINGTRIGELKKAILGDESTGTVICRD